MRCCILNPIQKLRPMLARYRAIARMTRELEESSDRALQEIGIARGDIATVAHGAYGRI